MNLKSLETEQRNPNTRSIDSMTTAGILETCLLYTSLLNQRLKLGFITPTRRSIRRPRPSLRRWFRS